MLLRPQPLAFLWLGTSERWHEVIVKGEGRALLRETMWHQKQTHYQRRHTVVSYRVPASYESARPCAVILKKSRLEKFLKGLCFLGLSCVRRAVWIVEAETGGLQLWEKGGRGQDEGRRGHPSTPQCTPQATCGLELWGQYKYRWLLVGKTNPNNKTSTNQSVAWDAKEKTYSGVDHREQCLVEKLQFLGLDEGNPVTY